MSYPRVKVVSRHQDFAPLGQVREVTTDEAKLLCMIGRAELLREGTPASSEVPARVIAPVTRDMPSRGKSNRGRR